MLKLWAWSWYQTLTLCAATTVDLSFPQGIMGLFGFQIRPHGNAAVSRDPRFLSVHTNAAEDSLTDRHDDVRAQFEVLNTDRYDQLLLSARRKRHSAAQILAAAKRSGAGPPERPSDGGKEVATGTSEEVSTLRAYNMKQAALLQAEAENEEREAMRIKSMVKAVRLSLSSGEEGSLPECEILKIGPLIFVPDPDELLHNNSSNMAQVTGSALTLYHNKELKSTYFWEGVELPVKATEDSPNCLAFHYRASEQVLCATSPSARDSWIDAFTEAWFCRHMGIKGTLPSIKGAEREAQLEVIPPPPQKPEEGTNAAVNVDFSVDANHKIRVKVNGTEHPAGERIMLDTQKLAKEAAAQAEEQAVTKAAMEISKRAEKVATSGKAVESSEYTPSDEGMEADSGELNVPTETEEESDEEDLPEK